MPAEDACRRWRRGDRNTGRGRAKDADAGGCSLEKKEDEKRIQRAWGSIKLQGRAHHQSEVSGERMDKD